MHPSHTTSYNFFSIESKSTVMPARVSHRNTFDNDHCHESSHQTANTKKKPLNVTSIASSKNRKPGRTITANKEQTNTKTKVTFRQSVTVQKVLHVIDYTSVERSATWYTDRDFAAMRQDVDQMVKKLEMFGIKRCREANPDFTIRGLESRRKESGKDRRQNKIIARKVVLEKQALRKSQNGGVCEPEYLAMIYEDETHHCQVLAQEIGMDDEYVAKKIR